ncbi:uncharacterized protein LOC122282338 [Carya illinoinensis]|uniref:uncharacterized protein LOC122282338 n=1 Tax=Carya illinoinensis TaxID=32201 RepID=UPI001C7293C1|nr:uncharacterized protein LOC122282338 [Carya illinoinensis]
MERVLWDELARESNSTDPWLVTWDFNIIANDGERHGGRPRPVVAMEEFNYWIHNCGLMELKYLGKSYSWCNEHAGNSRSWARLDRSLVDQHFLDAFPDSVMRYLPRTSSDHASMVISFVKSFEGYGPAPFHFQQMWVDHVDFVRCVREAWDQNDVGGALMKMVAKLKRVSVALKAWNKVVFGWTSGHIQELEARIERLDEQLQVRYEEDVEQDLLASKMELDTWTNREEIRLAQCAKVRWWKHGDKNSRYFHALLNKRKQTRIMEMTMSNGTTLKTPQDIHDGAMKYFIDFLGQSNRVVLPDLGDLVSHVISDEDNLRFCSLPTEEEVKQAVFSIPIESSPGPDGFGSDFYRACWDIVHVEVVEAVRDFFKGVFFPRFYTASFVVLIPKMAQPTGFDKFRPISLCSVFYKICTNVLVARLAPLLPSMISSEQCAFIQGFGFPPSVMTLIKNCIESPCYSHPRGAPLVSHLLYADDVVRFTNGRKKSMRELMKVIETYESWSGERVSKEKTAIYFAKQFSTRRKRDLMNIIGFIEGNFPFTYLGAPIVTGRLTNLHLDPILNRVRNKLGGWKVKCLSVGGKLILLKHVLSNGKGKKKWAGWKLMCKPTEEERIGLRDFDEVQQSLHMKFAWKIMTGSDLWSQFFRAKYVGDNHISLMDPKKGSRFWKIVVKCIPAVLENSKWKVREGNISFWWDNWLNEGPLANSYPVIDESSMRLADVRIENGWDIDVLERLVGAQKTEEICSFLGVHKDGDVASEIWKRFSLILGLPYDPNRRWCKARMEGKTILTEEIWRSICVWLRRVQNSLTTITKIGVVDEERLRDLSIPVLPIKKVQAKLVCWKKPKNGRLKLNIDGCSLGNPGSSGAGGIIRDMHGNMVLSFSCSLGVGSNNHAELKALLIGLKYCRALGLNQVDIESDSLICVSWIQKKHCGVWYLEDFWEEAMRLYAGGVFTIHHVYREGNASANLLAKMGAHGSTLV